MSLRANTIYNFVGALAPMLVSIMTVPPYLRVVGLERYGVISLLWVVLTYFSLFDLGLGRAVAQRLASLGNSASAEADSNAVVWSGLIISVSMGLLGALLLVPVATFVIDKLDANASVFSGEIRTSLPLLAATLPIILVQGIAVGALTGRERFGVVNLVEGASNILTIAAPLVIAIIFGPELSHLIATVLGVRFVAALFLVYRTAVAIPLSAPVAPDWPSASRLIGFGGWVTIDGLVGTAIAMWDRFVVGAMLGAAAVSIYAIPSTLVMRLLIIPGAFGRAFFPRLAKLTETDARALTADGIFALSLVLAPAVVVGVALIEPFLTIWIGPKLAAQSAPVAQILLPAIYCNSIASMLVTLIQSRNQPSALAWLHIAEIAPYALILFVAIKMGGVEGAALAWSLRTMIDAAALALVAKLPRSTVLALVVPVLLLIGSAAAAYAMPMSDPVYWVLQAAFFTTTLLAVSRQAPPQARSMIRSFADRMPRRTANL